MERVTDPTGGRAGALEQELSSLRFAAVARRLSETARSAGADVPAFRSPPRAAGVHRSIRRDRNGAATVAVALRGRPGIAVIADMIDGVMAAADLSPADAAPMRDQLWTAAARLLQAEAEETAEPSEPPSALPSALLRQAA
ncbi:MAG: hypothetical protein AAGD35_20755 [Actinomycetota bacterium]